MRIKKSFQVIRYGLILFLVFISMFYSQAKVNSEIEEEEAGITPDSIFWGLDRAIEKIQLLLTFDIAKKAELRLKIANERLSEVKVMIEKNKVKEFERAEIERKNEIKQLEYLSEKITEENEIINIQENLQKHLDKVEELEGKVSPAIRVPFNESEIDEPKEGKAEKAISVPIEREPAPDWILDKAKEDIISYVGEEYFDYHISVKTSWTESKIDKFGAKYRIYYDYKFKIKGDLDESNIEFFLLLDPDGNLVEYRGTKYRGPQKPYAFNVSRNEALEIAIDEELPESTIKIIEKGGIIYEHPRLTTARIEFGPKFSIRESYIWYVMTENYKAGKPEVVYIDVDSGAVLGIYVEEIEEVSYVCCKGITFYSKDYAKNAGYIDCMVGECESSPTDEEKQEWICPKKEHINCMPIVSNEMIPFCRSPYSRWISENCPNISFSV